MGTGSFNADEVAKKAGDKSQNPFKNMFDVLKVYTLSEVFLNTPDVATKPAADLKYITK